MLLGMIKYADSEHGQQQEATDDAHSKARKLMQSTRHGQGAVAAAPRLPLDFQ